VAALIVFRKLLLLLMVAVHLPLDLHAAAATPTDQQVKAVFVYNFSHFVDWPATAFDSGDEPFVIGVMGNDTFAGLLEDAVRGEHVNAHPIQVRRISASDADSPLHILYVDRSESRQLEQVVAQVKDRGTLTVSDLEDATQRGAMIQFVNVNNRIRLRINVDSARTAGLTVNSNLLRQADIVQNRTRQ
jgi:hypothetical protein